MQTTTEETAIIQKTKELCETLLQQPEFQNIRQRVDSFLADEKARTQFDALNEKGEFLHHKQHQGVQLTKAEIADFEKDRDSVLGNPVIRNFLDAQQEMHKITETVEKYVGKTFELGRVPNADELKGGSGGGGGSCDNHGGCGCH
jgi:cell fate (sporulation/competence/biofilm development) regulator YlbF (YheA/YmcA/DUF963 family)